ncbi:MAG: hypothetical protein JWM27_2721 [Gemmatimonadetes bacterium]|nr:hypothetical protein [Gemmatimonadota bacterium]
MDPSENEYRRGRDSPPPPRTEAGRQTGKRNDQGRPCQPGPATRGWGSRPFPARSHPPPRAAPRGPRSPPSARNAAFRAVIPCRHALNGLCGRALPRLRNDGPRMTRGAGVGADSAGWRADGPLRSHDERTRANARSVAAASSSSIPDAGIDMAHALYPGGDARSRIRRIRSIDPCRRSAHPHSRLSAEPASLSAVQRSPHFHCLSETPGRAAAYQSRRRSAGPSAGERRLPARCRARPLRPSFRSALRRRFPGSSHRCPTRSPLQPRIPVSLRHS